jgi:DEAD/DEAH box helicase domain-containing protein
VDTLVFDIETSNFFTDPEVGWNNFGALKISVVGIYSYMEDKYFCFEESEMDKIAAMFAKAKELVGFSMNHYDIPVLSAYFSKISPDLDLWKKDRFDIASKMEAETGRRISLSRLAEANLGEKKDRHGSEAITLFKDGKIEELKNYCLKDVRLTKELYDLMSRQNYLHFPDSGGELIKINFAPRNFDARTASLF